MSHFHGSSLPIGHAQDYGHQNQPHTTSISNILSLFSPYLESLWVFHCHICIQTESMNDKVISFMLTISPAVTSDHSNGDFSSYLKLFHLAMLPLIPDAFAHLCHRCKQFGPHLWSQMYFVSFFLLKINIFYFRLKYV